MAVTIKNPILNDYNLKVFTVYKQYSHDELFQPPEDENDKILKFIQLIKGEPEMEEETDSGNAMIKEIYTRGNCGWFYHILKSQYPTALPVYIREIGHIVTEINGRLYDVRGEFVIEDNCLEKKYVDEDFLEDFSFNYSIRYRGAIL